METKESFMTIVTEINGVTSSCTSIANQCVELLLSRIEVKKEDIYTALSNVELQTKLKDLALCISQFDRSKIVDYSIALLTFPLNSFLDQKDYVIVEAYLREWLFRLSQLITPEDILLGIINKTR